MNPATLTAAISSLGVAIAALIAALGDTALATPVRAAFAAAAPLIVMVLTFAIHKTEQAKINGGAAVATAKATPAAAPDLSSAIGPVLAALGGGASAPPHA
jgi:hypothetical protein